MSCRQAHLQVGRKGALRLVSAAIVAAGMIVFVQNAAAASAEKPVAVAKAATIGPIGAHRTSSRSVRPRPVYRIRVLNADGLDRAQLAQAGRTGMVPAQRAAVKTPVDSFTAHRPAGQAAAKVAVPNAATLYPGMYVPPGTPTSVVDSATYAGGLYPADIYQFMSASDCQLREPNGGTYTKNRYSSCAVHEWTGTLTECDTNGQNCVTVGTASWRQTTVGQGTDGDADGGAGNGSRVVNYQVTIDNVTTTGEGAAFTLRLDMACNAEGGWACAADAGNGQSALITTWETPGSNTASFGFTSAITDGDGGDHIVVASATVTGTLSYTDPTTGQALTATTGAADASAAFRFDSAGRNPAWITKWTGRLDGVVFDTVPVLSYDATCGNANCLAIVQSVSHIQLAYTNRAGTMPTWSGGGLKPAIPGAGLNPTDWLSRTTDDTRISLNGSVATAVCGIFLPVVPAGSNCDEFPFKTTYQGAGSGGPYSVLRIDGNDNQEAGRRLGAFYTLQRLLDCNPLTGGDGCDAFGVAVYGTGAPAPYPYVVIDEVPGGTFSDEWTQDGGAAGFLGTPADAEYAITGGQEQDFSGGDVYWSSGTGTHEVHGAILSDYRGLGGPGSQLGFPLSDQQAAPGGGQENLFAGTTCGSNSGAAILWTTATGAGEMQGCIYQAYLNTYGGPAGSLGYPTSNEEAIGSGRANYMAGTACGSSSGSAIYWNGAAHAVTGCLFQKYKSLGEATGSLGFPAGDAFTITGGQEQIFQHGYLTDVNGVVSQQSWLVGHAAHAGNDYPYETIGQFEHQSEGTDAWNEYYGQCDSFAAWKAYENLAGSAAQHPAIVPAPGWTPTNASVSPVNQFAWGNADVWATKWRALGYTVDNVPAPGAIVWWPNALPDPQDGNPPDPVHGLPGSTTGHVGYVTDVYPDGSITVEMYNMRVNGEYSVVHMAYDQGYTDNSFGLGNYSVPWPGGFIHVADGPAPGVASPPEPSPGVVQSTYPTQVKVIGPGSSASQFSLGNVWYSNPGFGEIGQEEYTHTNGPTAASTATWTPSGLAASACYEVDALVPNEYADNPVAVYTVSDAKGTSMAAVNENQTTNDWAELGVFQTNASGGITVKLDDRGTVNLWVAADAMRFWRQASCSGYVDASPIIGPTSLSSGWATLAVASASRACGAADLPDDGGGGELFSASALAGGGRQAFPHPRCDGGLRARMRRRRAGLGAALAARAPPVDGGAAGAGPGRVPARQDHG
jgi:surface antigen